MKKYVNSNIWYRFATVAMVSGSLAACGGNSVSEPGETEVNDTSGNTDMTGVDSDSDTAGSDTAGESGDDSGNSPGDTAAGDTTDSNSGDSSDDTTESNSGDDTDSFDTNPTADTGTEVAIFPQRLRTISIDIDRDNSINQVWTYSYDSVGRIISRDISNIDNPDSNRVVSYNYEGDNLVSKISTDGRQDTHIYNESGLLVSSMRQEDAHEYRYDANGRLIGSTGPDFLVSISDCDDIDSEALQPSLDFTLTYEGQRLTQAASEGGTPYRLEIMYDNQGRLFELQKFCGDDIESDDLTYYNYNDAGQLASIRDIRLSPFGDNISSSETSEFSYNEAGLVTTIVEFEGSEQATTTTNTHTPEGYLLTQDLVNNPDQGGSFVIFRDISITYEYEDASCRVALTSNPANQLIVDAFRLPDTGAGPLDCVYRLDEGQF